MAKKSNKFVAGIYLSVLVLVLIIGTGSVFYHFYEGLSWINSFYFTTMTVVTVGFGDFAPTKPLSRIFTIVFALISIPAILFCLGFVIEGFLKMRIDKVEDRMDLLMEEEQEIARREKQILANEEKILAQVKKGR